MLMIGVIKCLTLNYQSLSKSWNSNHFLNKENKLLFIGALEMRLVRSSSTAAQGLSNERSSVSLTGNRSAGWKTADSYPQSNHIVYTKNGLL